MSVSGEVVVFLGLVGDLDDFLDLAMVGPLTVTMMAKTTTTTASCGECGVPLSHQVTEQNSEIIREESDYSVKI